jgi:hypothetical protein
MEILEETYDELLRHGLTTNCCDFSVNWLNKSRRYMAMIRASDRDASVDALTRLAVNLKHHTNICKESRYGELRQKADWLHPLTQKVWTALYEQTLAERF